MNINIQHIYLAISISHLNKLDLKHSKTNLAELIFHELAHRRLFVADDATFNESFATATARTCVIRWLKSKSDEEAERRYRAEYQREDIFVSLVLKTRKILKELYHDL